MISKEEIKKLSDLSRVKISDEEAHEMSSDIEEILKYIKQISEIKMNGLEDNLGRTICNVLREDENPHEGGIFTDDLVSQAPNSEGNWVKVKKILNNKKTN